MSNHPRPPHSTTPDSNTTAATTTLQITQKIDNAPPTRFRLARRIVRAYREQMDKETEASLRTRFAALDRRIGQVQSRLPDRADPLEQLWRLPARPPRAF
jgi:hypothetical protein